MPSRHFLDIFAGISMEIKSWYTVVIAGLQFQLCNGARASQSNSMSRDVIEQINTFHDCSINLFNYRGLNVNMKILLQPLALYRYFNKFRGILLYPHEIKHMNQTTLDDFNYSGKSLQYTSSLYTHRYRTTNKLSICELEIFLHPPAVSEEPGLYLNCCDELAILTPYLAYANIYFKPQTWREFAFGPTFLYSILAYESWNKKICTDGTCSAWIVLTRHSAHAPRHYEQLQVWNTLKFRVHTHCRYCDPCHPETFTTTDDPKLSQAFHVPLYANHLVSGSMPDIAYRKNVFKSRHALITTLRTSKSLDNDEEFENLGSVFDPHFIFLMFGNNITNRFFTKVRNNDCHYRHIRLRPCGEERFYSSPHLLPHLERLTETTIHRF